MSTQQTQNSQERRKFVVGDKVRINHIDGTIHYDYLLGLEGEVISVHDEWSFGSNMCPYIMVDFGSLDKNYRFYPNELELIS